MPFLDSLSEYLRQIHSGDTGDGVPAASVLDPAFARNALVHCLERLESKIKVDRNANAQWPELEVLFQQWQSGDRVVRFANSLFRLLRESIGHSASVSEMEAWIGTAIAREVGLGDSLSSFVRTMELDRLSVIAKRRLSSTVFGSIDVAMYASVIRATKGPALHETLTPIGKVFLELEGRDVIRWLLHVEAAQSIGAVDGWRISREAARYLEENRLIHLKQGFAAELPLSWSSIKRLEFMGLIKISELDGHREMSLDVLPLGGQILSEIADGNATAMSVLAESIISDLTLSAVKIGANGNRRAVASAESTAVTEATVRQSRLVAHEIRNMLVPVKTALGAFYREVLTAEHPGDVVARRKEGIDRGIDSVFRFIGQLVELSQFAATPPEPFDLLVAIRDAVSTVELESGLRIPLVLPAQLPPVSGHRARVVTALTNILRNATQVASSESTSIRLEAESIEGGSAVRLLVDDNGPGVPENMRRAIFDEGVSLRGGSGLGLALVREVFEKEMRGLVACETSPLGGARFVVRVPATGTERS